MLLPGELGFELSNALLRGLELIDGSALGCLQAAQIGVELLLIGCQLAGEAVTDTRRSNPGDGFVE